MTELNIAYAYNNDDDYKQLNDDIDYQSQQLPQQSQQPQQQPQQSQQLPQLPPPSPPANYYIQNQHHQQHHQQQPQIIKRTRNPEYSFWDRMAMSRNDVFKLVLLAFVIVLGISIEKIGCHYITQYLTENVLSPLQEFIVRISFPVVIFLLLWIIKSL
jgi:hypothetical protein